MVEKLSIYKDTYTLTNKIYNAMPQIAKSHRYLIGSKMIDSSLNLFKWITMANKNRNKEERLKYLDCFLCEFELIRTYMRICADNKFLKLSTITDIQILISNISRQLSGWISATTRMQQ
ncbi:MAG: four helix bundle protein [Clostridia bacterium]